MIRRLLRQSYETKKKRLSTKSGLKDLKFSLLERTPLLLRQERNSLSLTGENPKEGKGMRILLFDRKQGILKEVWVCSYEFIS